MSSFEAPPIQTSQKKEKDHDTEFGYEKHVKNLYNEKRGLICRIEWKTRNGFIEHAVLYGKRGDEKVSIDLLELTGAKHGLDVRVVDGRSGSYDINTKIAECPPLENTIAIGIFLHELGHARQFEEEGFRHLWKKSKYMYGVEEKLEFIKDFQKRISGTETPETTRALKEAPRLIKKVKKGKATSKKYFEEHVIPRRDEYKKLFEERILSGLSCSKQEFMGLLEKIQEVPERERAQMSQRVVEMLKQKGVLFEPTFPPTVLAAPNAKQLAWGLFREDPYHRPDSFKHQSPSIPGSFQSPDARGWYSVQMAIKDPKIFYKGVEQIDEEFRKKLDPFEETWHHMEDKIGEAEQTLRDMLSPIARHLDRLQIHIGERDATNRALRWMREIKRRTGINLFQQVLVDLKQTSLLRLIANDKRGEEVPWDVGEFFSKFCESSQPIKSPEKIRITPQASLKAGLATYGGLGRHIRVHQSEEDAAGKIPRIIQKRSAEQRGKMKGF